MNRSSKWSLLILIVLLPFVSRSQCPSCDLALARNTKDYYQKELSSDFTSVMKKIFSYDFSYFSSGQWKENQEFQSGGSYGIISGFLNGSQSKESQKTNFNTMKAYFETNQDIQQSDYQFISQTVESPTLYDAWKECIKICDFKGIILDKHVTGNELTITLYFQNTTSDEVERLTSISSGNLKALPNSGLSKDQQIRGRNAYQASFRILDIHEPSYVSVAVSNLKAANIIIPAVPRDNVVNNFPIGTIITSVLDWKRFCRLNGQNDVLTDYGDKVRCKWVPADGRSVIGSSYGGAENNVPDLRGVFLRALNDFGVAGAPQIPDAQAEKDKDGKLLNRFPDVLESDAFQKHNHTVPGGDGGGLGRTSYALEAVGRTNVYPTSDAGSESETRPKNKGIYYYIKIN